MERTTGTILGPDGAPAEVPTIVLDDDAARTFREYKKVLQRLGLKEALYCNECWDRNLDHGCEAYVTSSQIVVKCRCRIRFHQGFSV